MLNCTVTNRFEIHSNGVLLGSGNNLVVDQGLDFIGDGDIPFTDLVVGSGVAAVDEGDTGLDVHEFTKAIAISGGNPSASRADTVLQYVYTVNVDPGEFTGTISEIGVGRGSAIFSRALLDTPVEITELTPWVVTYYVHVIVGFNGYTGTITNPGGSYPYSLAPHTNILAWWGIAFREGLNEIELSSGGSPSSFGVMYCRDTTAGGGAWETPSGTIVQLSDYLTTEIGATSSSRTYRYPFGNYSNALGPDCRLLDVVDLVSVVLDGPMPVSLAAASHYLYIDLTISWARPVI